MTETFEPELFEALDEGNVTEYVEERLFGNKIDALNPHIERKKALAEPTRYSILYLLFEYGQISRKRLADETGRNSNDLQHHLRDLLDTNLIAKIPAPEDADGRQTYYRITILGKQEIASDIQHIVGGHEDQNRFEALGDPELVESMREDGRKRVLAVAEDEVEELDNRRQDLRTQRKNFQAVDRLG